MEGAGSLAHEWGHAVDDYFGRLSNDRTADQKYMSFGKVYGKDSELRPEMFEQWLKLSKIIDERPLTKQEIIEKKEAFINQRIKYSLTWIDNMFYKVRDNEKFKKFREKIVNNELPIVEKKIIKGNPPMHIYDGLLELYKELKVDQYRADFNKKIKGINGNIKFIPSAMKELEEFKKGIFKKADGTPYTLMGETDYLKHSKKLDGDKGIAKNNYWATKHEMFARAFESYVQDKLESNGRSNSYLVQGTEYDSRNAVPLHLAITDDESRVPKEYKAAISELRPKALSELLKDEKFKELHEEFKKKEAEGKADLKNVDARSEARKLGKEIRRRVIMKSQAMYYGQKDPLCVYPTGKRRESINEAFDELFEALKKNDHEILRKAISTLDKLSKRSLRKRSSRADLLHLISLV